MTRFWLRSLAIGFVVFLCGGAINFIVDLESTLGLDTLLRIRGPQTPPSAIVLIAMDEASEHRLGVGQDLTRWRSFHAGLIQRLQQQGALLVVFDLQFIQPHPADDPALVAAMREAGNVLLVECVQKFRHGVEDFYGREECSDTNSQPVVARDGDSNTALSEQLVAMRSVTATAAIAEAALDHAPFFLINDAENASIREVWTFFDALAEAPSLPMVTWLYYLQRSGATAQTDRPFSAWLTEQRRACRSKSDGLPARSPLQRRIDNLLCNGDSRYLNYYGPPRTLRMESYSDVYDGKVGDLQGKVVFVGRANRQFSPGKSDFFQTPYSDSRTGKMAGVEIMATQFANLLEDCFIEMPAPSGLVSGAFGLLVALVLVRFAGWTGIAISLAFASMYAGLAVWLFGLRHWWLPVAMPLLLQLPLSWLLTLAWSRYELMRERGRMLAFVRRVFPQWVGMLPAAPGQWTETANVGAASTERDVSGLCLATDIEGYTTIAARHSPREMWTLLNTYYQVLGHPVVSHDGVIADVTGDAMMAVWFDAPASSQRRAACLAALEMATAVASFNLSSSLAPLATRIGLHEGELTLGRLDAGDTSHYRAIGDTVNTASRIQGVNKYLGTKILASKSVTADLTDIVYRPVGAFRLLGRAEPVELLEIVGTVGQIDAQHNALYRQFADGLQAFRQGQWNDAARLFQDALEMNTDDGPTRFYRQQALARLQNPEQAWDGVITLDGK
ncbi:adenylate/guanylate cyclase domain-containing protein [Methylomonas montana]|uniref:CHASE2 domain-containing protein n=1 Tax=Methylomonas montana TaxID=3058963 RepID=UPI00265B1C74|nr:adenylate/guanylate cyclase domain-containing protein [Methylomonas montana]WKJ88868.1 adenylate/guanylate cyclase domain-containing protein [Methylomonas montana]